MAAQKGSALLIKVGNAASPEVFTTVAGLRDTSISINAETIDITNKDSSRNRTLLADAGIKSFSVSGSGVFTDAASEQTILTNFSASTFKNYQIIIPDFNTFTGAFQITSMEYSGSHNSEVTYSMSFESSGGVTIATV